MTDSHRTAERTCDRVMPTARSRPSSRVRSMIERARVLAMPSSGDDDGQSQQHVDQR